MSILEKIKQLLTPAPTAYDPSFWIAARCSRCGEIIRSRVDLRNDLSLVDSDEGAGTEYICRKVLMGSQGCYQRLEVELMFDSHRKLTSRQISGGEFVDER